MMPGIAPTPMPTPRWAVAPQDFNALLVLIQNQTFASNQLPMIQAAALCGYFTCDQCAALMNIFDFDADIYDRRFAVRFIKRLRNEVHHASLDALKRQLAADRDASLRYFSDRNINHTI